MVTLQMFLFVLSLSWCAVYESNAFEDFVHPDCWNKTICFKQVQQEDGVIGQRIGTNQNWAYEEPILIGDEDNCYAYERMETPFAVKYNKKWHKIIQTQFFSQKIKYTTCRHQGETCFDKAIAGSGYSTSCVEIEGHIILYFRDNETNDIKASQFPVPIGCGCEIKQTYK